VPVHAAGKLLSAEFPDIASRIATMKCSSGAIVNLVLGKGTQGADELKGKEILIPRREGGVLRSVQCVSDRFAGWAADDCTMIRIVAGSMPMPMPPDEQVLADCLEEINTRLGIDLKPDFTHVQAFPNAYPVYGPGHCELVADIRKQASPESGLCVCGDGLVAGGIPGVVQDAFEQIDSRVG
jgi:protoporphyrinogen oxidase